MSDELAIARRASGLASDDVQSIGIIGLYKEQTKKSKRKRSTSLPSGQHISNFAPPHKKHEPRASGRRGSLASTVMNGLTYFFKGGSPPRDHDPHFHSRTVIDILHEDHEERRFKWVIHPRDRRRRAFDVVTVIFVLYLAWKIPFSAGIGWFVNPPGLKTFEYFLDVWFVVDICLNFRTGFVHDGRVFGAVFCIISSFLHCSYFIF